METLNARKESVIQAISTLEDAVQLYQKSLTAPENTTSYTLFASKERLVETTRDSMIQRFEYCCDTLWKLLRDHLKKVELVTLDIIGPKSTFRALCNAKFITEQDAQAAISMIESRNMTSHTYKEEYADTIARSMPEYLALMQKLIALLKQ